MRELPIVAGGRRIGGLVLLLCMAACSMSTDGDRPGRAGPYAVGSQTFFIHDGTRPYDSVGGADDGIRVLVTEIWYPVEPGVAASGAYRVQRELALAFFDVTMRSELSAREQLLDNPWAADGLTLESRNF